MKRTFLVLLVVGSAVALTACSKKKKTGGEGEGMAPAGMKPMGMKPMGMKPMGMKPRPKGATGVIYEKHDKMHQLIKVAGKTCKKPGDSKCPEWKAVDAVLRKVSSKPVEKRLKILATAIELLAHKNENVRSTAVEACRQFHYRVLDKLAKNPKLLDKSYAKKMLVAVKSLKESYFNGWLMQEAAYFASIYGLVPLAIEIAEAHKKHNESLPRYVIENMTKYSRLEHFGLIKKYASNLADLQTAAAALKSMANFGDWKPGEKAKACEFALGIKPNKLDKKQMKSFGFSGYAYGYLALAKRCGDKKHLARLKKLKNKVKKDKDLKKKIAEVIKALK